MLVAGALASGPDSPRFLGEVITWEVTYMGVVGGHAWAQVVPGHADAVRAVCGARSAPWYTRVYAIDDQVISTWIPGSGSSRYQTQYREGSFHQDQDFTMVGAEVSVWQRQRGSDGWVESTRTHTTTPGAEDPVSAVYRLRDLTRAGEGPWTTPVFSGDRTWTLSASRVGAQRLKVPPLGEIDVEVYALATGHSGDIEQRGTFLVYLSSDELRIPVRTEVKTNFGTIRAHMVAYQPPTPR